MDLQVICMSIKFDISQKYFKLIYSRKLETRDGIDIPIAPGGLEINELEDEWRFRAQQAEIRRNDIRCLINNVIANKESKFYQKSSVENIAFVGYSLGGATGFRYLIEDGSRVSSFVAVDPFMFPVANWNNAYLSREVKSTIYNPESCAKIIKKKNPSILAILAPSWGVDRASIYNDNRDYVKLLQDEVEGFETIIIPKSTHISWSDLALWSPYNFNSGVFEVNDVSSNAIAQFLEKSFS
eukprot:TRINITY_DN1089_c0_g1_i1.p2 TRINITY_DN1089_c0_g1~~TRINITY_DN1089_c0_g1_i1.p2  ORF type:complete len:240 (+),score=48.74 TRINITY_DN1089_c0_g1_i1:744-1463(+)